MVFVKQYVMTELETIKVSLEEFFGPGREIVGVTTTLARTVPETRCGICHVTLVGLVFRVEIRSRRTRGQSIAFPVCPDRDACFYRKAVLDP